MREGIESIKAKVAEMSSTRDKVVYLLNEGFSNDQIALAVGSTKESVSSIKSKNKHLLRNTDTGGAGDLDTLGQQFVSDEDEGVELKIEEIDDMRFPVFKRFVTGTVFDKLWSDHVDEGGIYSGTVNICTGESGVGKSTLLVDFLHKARGSKVVVIDQETGEPFVSDEEVIPLYVSTEMTRNDIYFYKEKMPAIGKVPTLLVSDYVKAGGVWTAIRKAFLETDSHIILLDSYQDLVEKLKDICGWSATKSETKLVNLMVEAAEEHGKAIIAIQHLTKGGEYVGRSFLKHATTAMLELRFDKTNDRYASFSKNRRGGSTTHIPLYFTLDGDTGEIVYDEKRFNSLLNAGAHAKSEEERKAEMSAKFDDVFSTLKTEGEDEDGLGEATTEIQRDSDRNV